MNTIVRCLFCGSKSIEERDENLGRCNKCGHRFWYKIPDGKKQYAYFYDAEFKNEIVEEDIVVEDKKIPKGHWLYSVQHKTTRERKDVITDNLNAALADLGWSKQETWSLPIRYGGDIKEATNFFVQAEKAGLIGIDLAKPGADATVVTSIQGDNINIMVIDDVPPAAKPSPELMKAFKTLLPDVVKKPKGESNKAQIIAIIKTETVIGHEKVMEQIFEILKKVAVEKGGRSDDDHILKRSKITYYMYSKKGPNGTITSS